MEQEIFFKVKDNVKIKVCQILVFSIIGVFLSCNNKPIQCERPYNKKELLFIDSVKKAGQIIELSRFDYSSPDERYLKKCYLSSYYYISIKNIDSLELTNYDSVSKRMCKTLTFIYKNLIEDSILIYTDEFRINWYSKNYKLKNNHTCFYGYFISCKKEELEKYVGYKVIESGNTLKHVSIPKSSFLNFEEENYISCGKNLIDN